MSVFGRLRLLSPSPGAACVRRTAGLDQTQRLDTGSGRKGTGDLDGNGNSGGDILGDPAGRQNKGEPYADPRDDPNLPRRHLDRRELLQPRKIHRHESWAEAAKALKKQNAVAIGKMLKDPADGHDVIARLARGDATALQKIGINDYPDGLDVTGREWTLVQTRKGHVVYAGKYDGVELPSDVRGVAHNHPGPNPSADFGGTRRTPTTPLEVSDGGASYQDVIANWKAASDSGIAPSAADVHAISEGTPHVIYTRFVHRGNKRIDNPVDGDTANRVALHLSNTRVTRWNQRTKEYFYEVDVRVKDSAGDELWAGKMYVHWRASAPKTSDIYPTKPTRFQRPPQPGWQDATD